MKLRTRGILVHPEELTSDWIDWMADARLNRLGLHPVGGPSAHENLQRAIDLHTTPAQQRLLGQAAARGIQVDHEAHVMSWLLPRHLFAQHPEWFRMNQQGERVADFNLCPSEPEALDYTAHRTVLLASLLDTGSNKYYYWLDDVTDTACHCPGCRHLSPADQQLRILNTMLAALKKRDPQAKLCYLAYHEMLDVPRQVEPLEGIFLEYAPIYRDHHRPINDPDCAENVQESAPLEELIQFFGSKDSRVLEYWMDNSKFSDWTKPPKKLDLDEAVMAQDVDHYLSLGFEEITSFGCYLGPDYRELHGDPSLERYGELLYR